jgi:hypothetical protein
MPRRSRFPLLEYWRIRYSPTRIIYEKGVRRGLFGGNRGWLAAFLVFRGVVAIKHAVSRQSEHLVVDQLLPGERMSIRVIPVHNAKERKRLMRGR